MQKKWTLQRYQAVKEHSDLDASVLIRNLPLTLTLSPEGRSSFYITLLSSYL